MIILAGLFLLAVAAVGIWWSVTRTDYLPRLAAYLVKQALPVILKQMTPEEYAELRALNNRAASKEEFVTWLRLRRLRRRRK